MESVYVPIPISEVTEAAELPSKTYRLDLDKGRISGYTDGLEAVNQSIRKAIITPRFKCLIYDNQYGSEIKQSIIAEGASPAYAEAIIPGFIKDALRPDTRILNIYDISVEFENDKANIFFRVDTIFGKTTFEEAV